MEENEHTTAPGVQGIIPDDKLGSLSPSYNWLRWIWVVSSSSIYSGQRGNFFLYIYVNFERPTIMDEGEDAMQLLTVRI